MTQAPSLVGLFIAPINRTRIEYMVTGGLAAVVYGHPRMTLDVDLVLRLTPNDALEFVALWPTDAFYCPPIEVIHEERERPAHGHFNVIHTATALRADIYIAGEDDFNAWALAHRVPRRVEDEVVQFAPIEYVIVNKLRYFQMGGSDRHLRDVAQVLEISGSEINRSTLDTWIANLQVTNEWAEALAMHERP